MLEWVLVIVSIFQLFYGYQNVSQTQVRNYQTQYPQALGSPHWTQGTQGYYYEQSPQAVAYPPGY
jgi:hypothetical protein